MGMFKGCVYVFNSGDNSEEKIRAGLKKVAADCAGSEWYAFYKRMNEQYGLPQINVRAWAAYSPDDDWFISSDTYTEQTGSLENITETAKFYAETFGEAALAVCVCDSDCSFIALAEPGGGGECRIGGRWDGYAEEPDDSLLAPPLFLAEYVDGEDVEKIVNIWKQEFVFEEERLDAIAQLLHAPTFYCDAGEDGEIPDGAELIEEFCGEE